MTIIITLAKDDTTVPIKLDAGIYPSVTLPGYRICVPTMPTKNSAILLFAYFLERGIDEGYLSRFTRIMIDGLPVESLSARFFGQKMKLDAEAGAFLNKLKYAIENPRKTKKLQLL